MFIPSIPFAQVIDEGQQLAPARVAESNNTLPVIAGVAVSIVVVLVVSIIIIRVLKKR